MKLLAVLPLMLLLMFLNSILFMVGWNISMPYLFKLPEIGLLQSIGLVFVAHTMFKGGVVKADFKG